MKFFAFKLLFIISFFSATGQKIVNLENSWNVLYKAQGYTSTRCYKFMFDTLIDSYAYNILYYSESNKFDSINALPIALMRQEKKEVYMRYFEEEEEHLLYDFNINIYDTVELGSINAMLDLSFRVDTIDYVKVGDESRKRFHLRPIIDMATTKRQYWIEGIGSSMGLLELATTQYLDHTTELLCFKKNDTLQWNGPLQRCFISNKPPEAKMLIKSKDNKAFATFTIKEELLSSNFKIIIYDMDGEKIAERKIKNKKDLSFKKLKQGEYIIQLTDLFNRIYTTKKIDLYPVEELISE